MRIVFVPMEIERAMLAGAALVISISGGKDSQAVLSAMADLHEARGWSGDFVVVHADLGRIEWTGTAEHVRANAAAVDRPLHVVSAGDMVDHWRRRMMKLAGTGKPFWSSAAHRYCTSDLKRTPIDKFLRRYDLVVSVDGVRADESVARAKKPVLAIRERITSTKLRKLDLDEAITLKKLSQSSAQRLAFDWHAIHDWSLDDVWTACGTSTADVAHRRRLFAAGREAEALAGFPAHHAYVRGNDRLSCSICVLASDEDIRNGARNRPDVARELLGMEADSGFTFKHKKSLASIIAGVLEGNHDHAL